MLFSKDISFYIISLGCSKNLVDSEKINAHMINAGYKASETSEETDIIIINTCGFIKPAKEESIDVILDSVDLNENVRTVVTGCLSQRYFNEISKDMPEIDFLYGLPDDNFVKELSTKFNIKISDNEKKIIRKPLVDFIPFVYLKISEGCSNNCSYCAIPLIRGPHKSYSREKILSEAEAAADAGAKEIIVIAQDITRYSDENTGLVELVEEISLIKSIQWIRLLYCHPDHISDDIIKLIKNNRKVVRYIDIPFQHISKKILKTMGRKGDFETYYNLVKKLRNDIPGIKIRSTFMLGYPGEDDNDFETVLDFINKTELDRVGGFLFSREENTRAYDFENQVPEKVKNERYKIFMNNQQKISKKKLEQMIGENVEVLVEEKVDQYNYIGRSEFDAPEVDGIFYLTAKDVKINSIVKAKVTDAIDYDLIGEII